MKYVKHAQNVEVLSEVVGGGSAQKARNQGSYAHHSDADPASETECRARMGINSFFIQTTHISNCKTMCSTGQCTRLGADPNVVYPVK